MTGLFVATALAGALLTSSSHEPVHKFHVTYGRMAVEGDVAACEIRFFKHDLEDALAQYGGVTGFELAADTRPDSLFLSYLNSKFVVLLNDGRVNATLSGSGEETVGQDEMWWYMVQYRTENAIASLDVTNRLLFEMFDDQRNILKVQHFPSEKQSTFYFVPDSDHHQVEFPS